MPVDHYENFPVASVLLPVRLRHPVEAIYRFARGADDIADEGDAGDMERLAGLAKWRDQLHRVGAGAAALPEPAGPMFNVLGEVIRRHALPLALLEDLLDAFSQDVVKKSYDDFPQVLDYCRRSANPIGRLLLTLYGVTDAEALRRSDAICSALQLINFWQDVGVDLAKGRVYLPRDSLVRFGVHTPSACDEPFRALMAFEVSRARSLMQSGAPLARALPGRIGWELSLVVQGGLRILEKIEAVGYDVFTRRPVLGRVDWMMLTTRAFKSRWTAPVQ
jgi:squalene synthase HpnC